MKKIKLFLIAFAVTGLMFTYSCGGGSTTDETETEEVKTEEMKTEETKTEEMNVETKDSTNVEIEKDSTKTD